MTMTADSSGVGFPAAPFSLIAELTHRCPLHCLYCSNRLEMKKADDELSTDEWKRVFQEAAAMGVLHVHLTGGEPLARKDLPELIEAGRAAGLYGGKIHLEAVYPDYFGSFPKACVGRWGARRCLSIPWRVLPCHSASIIPGLAFDSVLEHPLAWIWNESPAFMRFRGDGWMSKTCLECPQKEQDFGGCRCQAFLLTGDADAMDPVCGYSRIMASSWNFG